MEEEIIIQKINKTKKQKSVVFASLILVDTEAFETEENTKSKMTEYWES